MVCYGQTHTLQENFESDACILPGPYAAPATKSDTWTSKMIREFQLNPHLPHKVARTFFDLTYWLPTTTSPLLLATTTTTTVTTNTTTTFTTTTTSAVARAIPARLRTSWYVLNLNTKLPPFPPWMFWSKPKKNVSINNKKIITHNHHMQAPDGVVGKRWRN